jgi:hypothetical protein
VTLRDAHWLPQPTGGLPAGGAEHPGFQHGRRVAIAARDQVGVWLDLSTGRTHGAAHDQAYRIRHKPSIAFRPAGSFEARVERRPNGYAVQVRYVGMAGVSS